MAPTMATSSTTPAAWNDPTKGGELARSQFERGADVIYAAAGATGLGVLQVGVLAQLVGGCVARRVRECEGW